MAYTPRQEGTLVPRNVSSASSMDTAASGIHDGGNELGTPQPVLSLQPIGTTNFNMRTVPYGQATSISSIGTTEQQTSSSITLVPRPSQLQLSPSTGAVVPCPVPSTNTVPEFLYQLTKMLTDNNRIVIEWSNGKIEVHNPHKLQTQVLNRYFRHSKFASFQRQLNYFGFRKLAGKGKMAPCSYVNDSTTNELGSLLLVKRKTGNEPKPKGGKKREREDSIGTQGNLGSSPRETAVNPVLAHILYRSTGDQMPASDASDKGTSISAIRGGQPQHSQQALARVAVGKGIRHSFTMPQTAKSSIVPQIKAARTANQPAAHTPVQAGLSALASNFKNSLQQATTTPSQIPDEPVTPLDMSISSYVPGSMRRDDSLVDLAMLPFVDGGALSITDDSAGLTFIDFPWQDPNFPPSDADEI